MLDPTVLKQVISRTAAGLVVLAVALAWVGMASAAPKRVGNGGPGDTPATSNAADDEATEDSSSADETSTEDEDAAKPAKPAPAAKGPKRVGNAGGDAAEPAAEESATDPADDELKELMEDALKEEAAQNGETPKPPTEGGKPATPDKPAAGDKPAKEAEPEAEAEPDAPATAAIPPAIKPKEKKVKDYVGKADQKRDARNLYRFNSGAYVITTDVDKDLANIIAVHMDRVYQEYAERLANFRPNPFAAVKPNEKMPLYVIRRYRDYLTLMQTFGFNAANSGGVFFRSQKNSGLATWVEGQTRFKMFNVLQHEGFHQFADARIIGGIQLLNGTVIELPPWANEGLAEYFGDAVMVKGELVIGRLDRDRLRRMKQGIKEEVVLPFRELMSLTNDQWVARITGGDKRASLMYDNVWSICHFLIHSGGKKQRAALEQYLITINNDFVTDPGRDRRGEAFNKIFGDNLENFEKAWRTGVARMEPDAWYTSIRHLQTVASALEKFRNEEVPVKSWPHLKEQMIRYKVKAVIRERDIVARGERKEAVEDEEQDLNFPDPAQARLVPSTDPKLPHGLLVTHIIPNLLLTWSINENGVLEQDISYIDPPRQQITEIKKFEKELALKEKQKKQAAAAAAAAAKSAGAGAKSGAAADKPGVTAGPKPTTKPAAPKTASAGSGEKPAKKGTIRVGS